MSTLDLTEGALFAGEFRVVRPLARGGMGSVYVVEQLSTGRQRALKVMHPLLVADAAQRTRFVQEARIGGLVESDHVVEVIGAGVDETSGIPWLCMELLVGETLAERVARLGPLSRGELKEVAAQLRHALSRAHARGLVHRDLKPDNLFLAEPRRYDVPFTLEVLDFGIAKLVQQAQGRTASTTASATQALGSPLWMAPEQANGEPVSVATDVWALGLVAFHALTGRSYWKTAARDGDIHITQLLVEILVDPLEPASARASALGAPAVPDPGFDAWLERCLQRDPSRRFADAGAALDALIAALSGDAAFSATLPSISTPSPTERDPGVSSSSPSDPAPVAPTPETRSRMPTHGPSNGPSPGPRAGGTGTGAGRTIAILGAGGLVLLGLVGVALLVGVFYSRRGGPARARPGSPAGAPAHGPPDDPGAAGRVATSEAGRRLYAGAIRPCWDELNRGSPQAATRMRVELRVGPAGRLSNVALPPRWRGTPFARCVATRLPRVQLGRPPPSRTVVLSLPAGGS